MNYQDDLVIGEMQEGKRYAMTDCGSSYSDGVWVIKEGDTLSFRHFWETWCLEDNKNNYYYLDKEDGVCYPTDEDEDQTEIVDKKAMGLKGIAENITKTFEEMTLGEFYDIVYREVHVLNGEEEDFPEEYQNTAKVLNREGNTLYES